MLAVSAGKQYCSPGADVSCSLTQHVANVSGAISSSSCSACRLMSMSVLNVVTCCYSQVVIYQFILTQPTSTLFLFLLQHTDKPHCLWAVICPTLLLTTSRLSGHSCWVREGLLSAWAAASTSDTWLRNMFEVNWYCTWLIVQLTSISGAV